MRQAMMQTQRRVQAAKCQPQLAAPRVANVGAVRCSLARKAQVTCASSAPAVTGQRLRAGAPVAARRVSRSASAAAAAAPRAEISYVMVKPDGVQRGLVGEIIGRFERKGFKLVGLKLYATPADVANEHYRDLKEKPFYKALVGYILSGPVVAMVWEGNGVVASARKLIGATNPLQSEPGTIRGDLAIEVGRNVIHGSDSVENGEREAALWFPEGLVTWDPAMTPWLKE